MWGNWAVRWTERTLPSRLPKKESLLRYLKIREKRVLFQHITGMKEHCRVPLQASLPKLCKEVTNAGITDSKSHTLSPES